MKHIIFPIIFLTIIPTASNFNELYKKVIIFLNGIILKYGVPAVVILKDSIHLALIGIGNNSNTNNSCKYRIVKRSIKLDRNDFFLIIHIVNKIKYKTTNDTRTR